MQGPTTGRREWGNWTTTPGRTKEARNGGNATKAAGNGRRNGTKAGNGRASVERERGGWAGARARRRPGSGGGRREGGEGGREGGGAHFVGVAFGQRWGFFGGFWDAAPHEARTGASASRPARISGTHNPEFAPRGHAVRAQGRAAPPTALQARRVARAGRSEGFWRSLGLGTRTPRPTGRHMVMGSSGSKLEKALGDQFPEGERYFGLENFGNTCYCNSVLQVLVVVVVVDCPSCRCGC